jgi:hypothetical protein
MSDQPSSGNNNSPRPAGTNQTNPNQRPHQNNNQNNQQNNLRRPQSGPHNGPGPKQNNDRPGSPNNNRRRPNRNHNRPRNPNQNPNPNPNSGGAPGLNIERIYEKYLNLLDQHLIARRKYHDLFYRADYGQKNKLERNFYNSLNDIRDFESRLAPEARVLFEKRNNGLSLDNIYTSNHDIPAIGDTPPPETESADPHFLQSQKLADFAADKEESKGSYDDYLKYKNLV